MSDYDRYANARAGAGIARSGAAAVDQGLRAYMLGVYNYMTLGLGLTGVVAYFAFMLADVQFVGGHRRPPAAFGQAIYYLVAALGGDLRAAGAGVRAFPPAAIRCRSSTTRAACSSPSRR